MCRVAGTELCGSGIPAVTPQSVLILCVQRQSVNNSSPVHIGTV